MTERVSAVKFCQRCGATLRWQTLNGIDRRSCESCGFVHWDNPIPVVAAVVELGSEVVLARNAAWPAGQFSIITGFLERGETPKQSVAREVYEELGLNSEAIEFIGDYSLLAQNQLLLAFAVRAAGQMRIGDELAEIRLIPKEDVDAKVFAKLPITAAIVRDWRSMAVAWRGGASKK